MWLIVELRYVNCSFAFKQERLTQALFSSQRTQTYIDSLLRAAKALLSGMELSLTALYFAKEQCRLSIKA